MDRAAIYANPTAWAQMVVQQCVVELSKSNTAPWLACKYLAALEIMLKERMLEGAAPLNIMYGRLTIIIDPSHWRSLKGMLSHKVNHPKLDKDTTLGQLLGASNRSTATRWINAWWLRVLLEQEGLPVLSDPAFFVSLWHSRPMTLTQAVEIWRSMLEHAKAENGGATLDQARDAIYNMRPADRYDISNIWLKLK